MKDDRLTIQYSVRADEMSKEIDRLVKRSHGRILELADKFDQDMLEIEQASQNNNITIFMNFITEIRDEIAEIDYSLNECASVAYGYHDYVLNRMRPAQPLQEGDFANLDDDHEG